MGVYWEGLAKAALPQGKRQGQGPRLCDRHKKTPRKGGAGLGYVVATIYVSFVQLQQSLQHRGKRPMSSFNPLVMSWAYSQKFGGLFLGEVARYPPRFHVHAKRALNLRASVSAYWCNASLHVRAHVVLATYAPVSRRYMSIFG
jgi:hypothetical protein